MSVCARYFRVPDSVIQALIAEADGEDCESESSTSYAKCPSVDLDKSWDSLHLFLTGGKEETSEPLSKAIHGNGNVIGDEFDGLHYLLPQEVREVSSALKLQNSETLAARMLAIDKDQLEEMDLYSFDVDNLEDQVLEAQHHFDIMRNFYEKAAADGEGMILVMG